MCLLQLLSAFLLFSSFSLPSFLSLKIGTLTECETHKFSKAAWPASPGDAPNSFPMPELQAYTITLGLQAHATRLGFHAGAEVLNSGASVL